MELDAVFRPGIDTLFSPTAFDYLEMERSSENPSLLDGEEDKDNFPPTILVSERPAEPPRLLRSPPCGRRNQNVLETVYRTLFD